MKKQTWFKKITLLFILIMFVNLLLAGSSFAYWAGNVTPPSNITNNINVNTGQGITENLTLSELHYYEDTDKLVPQGALEKAFDENAKEEIVDDFIINFPIVTSAVNTNLNIQFTNINFKLFDATLQNPPNYASFNQHLLVKVEVGYYTVATSRIMHVEATNIYNGSDFSQILSNPISSGTEKVLRITRYVEGAPINDSEFIDTIGVCDFNVDFQINLSDPNLTSSTVWVQYNLSGANHSQNMIETLGLYNNRVIHECTEPTTYSVGDTFVVTDPDSPYYNQVFSALVAGQIDVSNPNSSWFRPMTFSHVTNEYVGDHHYKADDVVMFKVGESYKMYSARRRHYPNTISESPPPDTWMWTEITNPPTPNYWFRYYRVSATSNIYYIARTTIRPGQSPEVRPELWKKVILN